MANEVVFVSKNRGIRLLSERECKEMMSFPTVSAHTCNTRKLAKPYFNAYSISSGHSYLLDVVCCCARELPVAWSPLDTIVFINRNVLFYTKEALLFALGKKGKKGEKLGECEATIKRRTDRPFKSKKMMKNMAKNTAMT